MKGHGFCRMAIKGIREEAAAANVKIPAFGGTAEEGFEKFVVFLGDDWYSDHNSCCRYAARAEAITEYLDEHKAIPAVPVQEKK